MLDLKHGFNSYRRLGFEEGYSGARVLLSRGIKSKTGRNVAAYCEYPASFQHTIYALRGDTRFADQLKFLTVLLNSALAGWWFFHTTASAGIDRPEVHTDDVLNIPFWTPEESNNPDQSKRIWDEIIELLDNLNEHKDVFSLSTHKDQNIKLFDDLIFQYYGLSKLESKVVTETVETVFPSIQPKRNSRELPPLWKASQPGDWTRYADTMKRQLQGWVVGNQSLDINLVAYSNDMVALKVDIHKNASTNSNELPFQNILDQVYKNLPSDISGNINLIPHLHIEIDGSIYIVKPRIKRFWLSSMAVSDADHIINELSE